MDSEPRPALKPCPFCGSDDVDTEAVHSGIVYWLVHCFNCGAEGPRKTDDADAMRAWDRRSEA